MPDRIVVLGGRQPQRIMLRRAAPAPAVDPERMAAREDKSLKQLVAWLDEAQRQSLERHGWFDMVSDLGNRWRIGPTLQFPTHATTGGLCVHLMYTNDAVLFPFTRTLAFFVRLRVDEEGFRAETRMRRGWG